MNRTVVVEVLNYSSSSFQLGGEYFESGGWKEGGGATSGSPADAAAGKGGAAAS